MHLSGIVVFPGTNCEFDVAESIDKAGGISQLIWHDTTDLSKFDSIVIAGGFAHGDYLRPGAIAKFSPVMSSIERFANDGGTVVGICNGFQVLTEVGLLPGALQKNDSLTFICKNVEIVVSSNFSPLTKNIEIGTELLIPINHFSGNFTVDSETLKVLEDSGRVVFRYKSNPNGSTASIAGISNETGNVVGLMPHPERASDILLGSEDGLRLLKNLILI